MVSWCFIYPYTVEELNVLWGFCLVILEKQENEKAKVLYITWFISVIHFVMLISGFVQLWHSQHGQGTSHQLLCLSFFFLLIAFYSVEIGMPCPNNLLLPCVLNLTADLSDGRLRISDFHISCFGFVYFRQVNGTFGQVIFTIHLPDGQVKCIQFEISKPDIIIECRNFVRTSQSVGQILVKYGKNNFFSLSDLF